MIYRYVGPDTHTKECRSAHAHSHTFNINMRIYVKHTRKRYTLFEALQLHQSLEVQNAMVRLRERYLVYL